jgi:hypothetical protein
MIRVSIKWSKQFTKRLAEEFLCWSRELGINAHQVNKSGSTALLLTKRFAVPAHIIDFLDHVSERKGDPEKADKRFFSLWHSPTRSIVEMYGPTSDEFQVKQTAYPNAGRSWYIVGRPGGKRTRTWFDTQLAAETAATQRNLSIQRFGQQAATFSGSLAYMAMECQSRLQEYGKSLHDATAQYLRHLESVNRSVSLSNVTSAVRREFERRLAAGKSANAISNPC